MFYKPSLSMIFFQHGSQRWHHQHPLQHGGVSVHLHDFYFDPLWSRVKQISIILRRTHTISQSSPWCCPGTTRAPSAPWAAGAPPLREAAWLASSRRWTWSSCCSCWWAWCWWALRWTWSKWSWFSGRRPRCVWRALPWLLRTERHHRLHDLCW